MSDKPKTLAEQVHDANYRIDSLEAELWKAISACCGPLSCGDEKEWTTDGYDNSIEVYGVGDIDLDGAAAKLRQLCGFTRVWLHQHVPPRGDCKCPCRR